MGIGYNKFMRNRRLRYDAEGAATEGSDRSAEPWMALHDSKKFMRKNTRNQYI